MRASLSELLSTGRVLLTDGATGTNYFAGGLMSGDPPEFWTVDRPDAVMDLHRRFIEAGSDIILTNTFGCNRQRLKLHKAQDRTYELARAAAELACKVVDSVDRPVVLVMTAAAERGMQSVEDDAVQAIIPKPFDVKELRNLVRSCVESRRQHEAGSALGAN